MRVYLLTPPSANNYAIPGSTVWLDNLSRGLLNLGVDVVLPAFNTLEFTLACTGRIDGVSAFRAREQYSEQIVSDVLRMHSEQRLDVFLAYVWDEHLLPQAVDAISETGITTVLFFCNAAHQFHLVQTIAPHFHYCMVPEYQALEKYRRIGARPVWVQMGADPEKYAPSQNPFRYDVAFVGQAYLNRPALIGYLVWNGIDVRVWGVGWLPETVQGETPLARRLRRLGGDAVRLGQKIMRLEPRWYPLPKTACHSVVTDHEMIEIFSVSRISLNFSEVADQTTGEIKRHIRLRDFEVPMSGGLLMTGYQEELSEFYEIDREIICYDTRDELLDKTRYYLRHPDEAAAIRAAGFRRAQRDHTWTNRFRSFFQTAGLMY